MQPAINPFFQPVYTAPAPARAERDPAQYAKLPQSPITGSPVPHLTSLYHNAEAGNYGSRSYPGNCSGNLIKDLLVYFRPDGIVFDPLCAAPHKGSCVAKHVMWLTLSLFRQ